MHFSLITWFMFPELVLELKVNLFSLTLCVLLPGGETVSQHSTKKKKKKKNNKKMEHLKKAPNHRGQSGPVPHKNRAWWEKAAKWHRISPEDSVWTFVMPLFFWFMNECCPVGFKGKKKFFVWIAQALDCVGFIHFYFNIILFFCTLDSRW